MPKGGVRKNAGARSKWKQGKTKMIRVPEVLADKILQYAHDLDEGAIIDTEAESKNNYNLVCESESKSESKILDLSKVSVGTLNSRTFVFLDNLIKSGFLLKPDILNDRVLTEIYKSGFKSYGQKS